jgi:uncharacterized FlaG/YvyC family protein
MMSGVMPIPQATAAPRDAAQPQARSGNPMPVAGAGQPLAPVADAAPPDLSRSAEVLDRYLAESQRSLRFLRDPGAGRTIILVVDPGTGEVLRQIPARERLALARWIAEPRPSVIDLRA